MSEQNLTPDHADAAEDTEGHVFAAISDDADNADTEGHVLRQKSDPTDPKKDVSESDDTEGHVLRQ